MHSFSNVRLLNMAFADLHGILLFALASCALNHPAMLQRIEPSLIRRFVYTNDLYTVPITPIHYGSATQCSNINHKPKATAYGLTRRKGTTFDI